MWIAEQEKKAEEIKMRELAQQIKQEREEEEMNKISGRKSNRLDRGIDWMYQGGGVRGKDEGPTAFEEEQEKKEQEDYLLGKEFNPSKVTKGDLAAAADSSSGVNFVLTRAAESTATAAAVADQETNPSGQMMEHSDVQDWNSNFHLRHEDPMFMVEKERKGRQEHEEKRERLIASVRDDGGDNDRSRRRRDRGDDRKKDSSRSDRKKRRTERKRRSRHERSVDRDERDYKRRSKDERYDEDRKSHSSESDEESRRRRRKRRHRSSGSGRRQRSSSVSYSRSRSRSRSPHGRRSRGYRDSEKRTYRGDELRTRDKGDENGRDRGFDRNERQRILHESHEIQSNREEDDKSLDHNRTPSKYGLIGSTVKQPHSDLGPDQSLLKKKRQEKEDARSRFKSFSSRGNRKSSGGTSAMSERERREALKNMQADASAREGHIAASKRVSNTDLLDEEIQRRREGGGASASFLGGSSR